ncbi:hypothetical protein NQZ68_033833 [Dissostichus eleginoides]|nr:hypothetical protein NQZ68_033833 [Dissostichus eleginoides]
MTYFLQGNLDQCLELLIRTNRLPEAAFLARTYLPSQVSRVVKLWRENLAKINQKAAESLADPTEYENLFPGLREAFAAEHYLRESCLGTTRPAKDFPLVTLNEDRNILEEAQGYEPKGTFIPAIPKTQDSEESVAAAPVAAAVAAVMSSQPEPAAPTAVDKEEEDEEEEEEEKEEISQSQKENLDELEEDLDNMEIYDIDTTDVNLDDDFLDD